MNENDFLQIILSAGREFEIYNIIGADYEYIPKGIMTIADSIKKSTKGKELAEKVNDILDIKVFKKENMPEVKGAIVTCNYISRADGFVVWKALNYGDMKVIVRENEIPSGEYGDFLTDIGYMPLGKNSTAIKNLSEAVEKYLSDGKKIIMFPESNVKNNEPQGYPYVLENNPFRYAAQYNVPVIPMYIVKKQSEDKECREIYVFNPIYPDADLNIRMNTENMRKANEQCWKEFL